MHLNNAGIVFIDKVLESAPDYCFIDWFTSCSTFTNHELVEYLNAIIFKFNNANCKLIFLFLPHKKNVERTPFYDQCKEHLKKYGCFFIDVSNFTSNIDLNKMLKDDVHTTSWGSEVYASCIYEKVENNFKSLKLLKFNEESKYRNIKVKKVNLAFTKKLELEGDCDIIGFHLLIGPHSGIVKVGLEKINIWDQYCHYTREHFNLNFSLDGRLDISILDDCFDKSQCKRELSDSKEHNKKMIIKNVFYIGSEFKILNLNQGKFLPYFFHSNKGIGMGVRIVKKLQSYISIK